MDKKIKVLLDTDIGGDCDDAGALMLLYKLCDKGYAETLAVTHCGSDIAGAVTVSAINEYFGRNNLPVGRYTKNKFLEDDCCRIFTPCIMDEYLKVKDVPSYDDAVRTMRRTLSENRNVTLISIGVLNNYAELLNSKADDISPLSGVELVRQSADSLYVMGGNFEDFTMAEYNIKCDVDSAVTVAEKCPVPIVYCGFELGESVRTGLCLKSVADNNPVKKIYSIYTKQIYNEETFLRESWDLITVYCAVFRENNLFELRDRKK